MKEPVAEDFWKDALERWNRLPSGERGGVVVRCAGIGGEGASEVADREGAAVLLRRMEGVWEVLESGAGKAGENVARRGRAGGAVEVEMPGSVLLPAFVNAHAHLDLTHVGPRSFDPDDPRGFAGWIDMVRTARATDPAHLRASVREGIEKSLRGGVVAVGDISGAMRTEPVDELRASPLVGVSFVEFFGTGPRQQPAMDAMRALVEGAEVADRGVRLGLSPHALYSAGPEVYREAGELHRAQGIALSTHLAESLPERRLIVDGEGPLRAFLASMGVVWQEARARSPVECFAARTSGERWLIAHANDLSDDDIEMLRAMDGCVAFCPRGHAYFGHARALGPHRWRDLCAAGVKVCLATDSIINLPRAHAERISPLDDARALFRECRTGDEAHDANLARQLLAMITTTPSAAMDLRAHNFRMIPGPKMGIVAVDVGEVGGRNPLVAVLESEAPPELLALSEKRALDRAGLLWEKQGA